MSVPVRVWVVMVIIVWGEPCPEISNVSSKSIEEGESQTSCSFLPLSLLIWANYLPLEPLV